jgi:RHS repeat-associated protein
VQKSYVSGTLNETRHLYYTEPSKWQVVEERVGTSTSANRQFVWGLRYIDDLILRDRDTDGNGTLDERLYSLQDANWNVTGLVNTSGVIQQRFVYTAYGLPVFLNSSFTSGSNTAGWEVLYAGYRFETAISLMHVRHRVLNPALGCWVQRDPLGLTAGINLYAYCSNNSLIDVDPAGLVPLWVLPALALLQGCLIGAAIGLTLQTLYDWLFNNVPLNAPLNATHFCAIIAGCFIGMCLTFPLSPWVAACVGFGMGICNGCAGRFVCPKPFFCL